MTEDTHLRIALLCFPGLTQLDMTGPYEVLVRMPRTRVHIVWKDTAPVRADRGLRILPDLSLKKRPIRMCSLFREDPASRI
jgi:cyclohexyl-isocyanide hydratase